MFKRLAIALAIVGAPSAAVTTAPPKAEPIAYVDWSLDDEAFGGMSGIEVDAQGHQFTAVSDTGVFYIGQFERSAQGVIEKVKVQQMQDLLFENGKRPKKKRDRDTEGLAISAQNHMFISAESKARLLRYSTDWAKPMISPLPNLDPQAPKNMGFEALAIDQHGQLFAVPEGSANIRTPFGVHRRDKNGIWSKIYELPRHGGFRPVGADFGADGHLYVLTRAFNGFAFASRIERVLFAKDVAKDHEILFSGRFGQFDNLEGLATWQAGPNDLRLYAISDDNFSALQSTTIVEFRLQE